MKHSPLRYVCLAIALCCLGIGLAEAGQRSVVDSLLRVLDKELTHSEQYLAQRVEQIDGLKATYYEHPTTETAYSIAELYAPYLCDSALRYYQLAQVLCPGEIPHHI